MNKDKTFFVYKRLGEGVTSPKINVRNMVRSKKGVKWSICI